MTLEDIASKAGHWGGWIVAAVVAVVGGLAKVFTAREAAKPAATEQAGVMMESAFSHLRAELDRQDAALKALREDGHRLRNALQKLEAAYGFLARFAQDCIDILADAGINPPDPPRGLTVDELMRGPVADYEFGQGGPVTRKDNGR